MKIAVFTPYYIERHGGVQEHVANQAEILRARGHDVTILTPRPLNMSNDEAPEGVVFIGASKLIKTPSATSAEVSSAMDNVAIDELLDENFDVIHVHEPLVPITGRQLLVRAKGKTLRVGTFHAALPGNRFGKTLLSSYKQYAKMVVPHVDVITAVSPAAIGFIADHLEDPSVINYIPNGIHIESYTPRKKKRDSNCVLFIGRLEKRKGAKQVIKAFAELKKRMPDAVLKIAGDGPLRASLKKYIADNGIDDVEFLGYIPTEEKLKLLSTCGVYTSPALYGESFGIVLAEAMSMGAPIVAHPNDGYSWVLRDTGRLSLVDCTDAEAYADRLQLMLEDDGLRRVWQEWAQEYVQQFDYEKVVDQYEALYKKYL